MLTCHGILAVSDAPAAIPETSDDDDVETGPMRADGYAPLSTDAVRPTRFPLPLVRPETHHPNAQTAPRVRYTTENPYRVLFPFLLIIIVVLLLVWRLAGTAGAPSSRKPCVCPVGSTPSTVVAGDTCWNIAEAHGCALDALLKLNPLLRCEKLMPGDRICVPLDSA